MSRNKITRADRLRINEAYDKKLVEYRLLGLDELKVLEKTVKGIYLKACKDIIMLKLRALIK